MAETDAFCWVNGVGMAHDYARNAWGFACRRCGKALELPKRQEAQEGRDAPKSAVLHENEGQNA